MNDTPPGRAVVVGASSGIGRAIAEDLADAGWDVVAGARQRRDLSAGVEFASVDVTDPASVAAFFEVVGDGPIDGLVYAAGITTPARGAAEFDPEAFDSLMAVNARGALLALKFAHRALAAARGRVVWIGSLATRQGSALSDVSYTASKAALAGAARQLALTLAPDGITLNVVHPGMTLTPMLQAALDRTPKDEQPPPPPAGRFAQPADVASVVRYLLSDAPSNLTGAGIDLNGGAFRGA